jgi:hypothetical protein
MMEAEEEEEETFLASHKFLTHIHTRARVYCYFNDEVQSKTFFTHHLVVVTLLLSPLSFCMYQ